MIPVNVLDAINYHHVKEISYPSLFFLGKSWDLVFRRWRGGLRDPSRVILSFVRRFLFDRVESGMGWVFWPFLYFVMDE